VCDTWEDHVWVRVVCLIETRMDSELSQYSGYFPANQQLSLALPHSTDTLEDIFESLLKNDDPQLR
jgi:hypothetical protein